MDQQPRGREKNVTGYGKPIEKRGEGLGTGPVGKKDGYRGRNQSGSPFGGSSSGGGHNRSGGGGKRIGIIGIILALVFGGGFGINSLFGGGQTPSTPVTNTGSGIFSGFSNSSISSKWDGEDNRKILNTSVSPAAAAKRTVIKGDGSDKATVMVYMCGTDLESKSGMASSDMKEMASATLNSNVDVIVYTGGCKSWRTGGISNSVNQIYKIHNGQMTCLVRNDGSDPMTRGTTLTRFINYCVKNYPANRKMLIFWDHGGGSISGFGYDERNPQSGSMSLKVIGDSLKATGQTFDFVGFDACLMGTLESALTLAPYSDYLIGSEETEPGVGWYYTNWLNNLARNPSISTLSLGKIIVDDFVAYCNQRCPGQKTTLSVVDLAELTATVPSAFKDFAVETAQLINSKDYKIVSDARAKTREFAISNKTDQIDIVDLANKLNTQDSKALADAVRGAVKYNDTSSSITNAYGLAIYFPYNKTSRVANAVKAYEAMGMDSNYTDCVRSFANLELSGQVVAGNQQPSSPLPSLQGSYSGQSPASSIDISSLLNALMGGGAASAAAPAQNTPSAVGAGSLMSIAGALLGGQRSFDVENAVEVIAENQLDTSNFVWVKNGDDYQLALNADQWSQIHSLALNVFYDDGEGYIDLGLDNVYRITENGELVSDFDGTWLAIDSQPVPYYYTDTFDDGTNYSITGYVPVMINGDRAELILVFDNANPKGYIAGARYVYTKGETETVAKGVESLTKGDKIEFICDYYGYDGTYQDSYLMGEPVIYNGENTISNVIIDADKCSATYLITDSYNNEYWTPVVPG